LTGALAGVALTGADDVEDAVCLGAGEVGALATALGPPADAAGLAPVVATAGAAAGVAAGVAPGLEATESIGFGAPGVAAAAAGAGAGVGFDGTAVDAATLPAGAAL
jgi:hypothetical protein